jgi:saccharopine dehydrogenase (NADP+, L-glutamate forming)/spermidine synthase
MNSVLVLGAGLVAKPLVDYFLEREAWRVDVADLAADRARAMVAGHPRGRFFGLDIEDDAALGTLVAGSDLVVSFVPYGHHPRVARHCLARGKHLVTASYVSSEMKDLDGPAKARGLIFLNEVGLDPGIDHMEAMRIIDGVRGGGGTVSSFVSYCGGLPAPEANTNPFGYKFSWSPLGVLLASGNSARYLLDGREVVLPAEELFERPAAVTVEGLGEFEGYPNRDSMSYLEAYGLEGARTVLRGTLRYPGWCHTLKRMRDMGLLDRRLLAPSLKTTAEFAAAAAGVPAAPHVAEHLRSRFTHPLDAGVLDRLEWLGLYADRPLPSGARNGLEVMAGLMSERMSYGPGERDMVVLQHRFTSADPDGRENRTVSTLVSYGVPGGDSAMARTVALPAAICARLIMDGVIRERGVIIPVLPEIYRPVLQELAGYGIRFEETTSASG